MGLPADDPVDLFVVGADFYLGSTRNGRLKDGWCDFRALGQRQAKEWFGTSRELGVVWYLATRVSPRELRSFGERERQNIWLGTQRTGVARIIIDDASQTTRRPGTLAPGSGFQCRTEEEAISELRKTSLAPEAIVISAGDDQLPLLSFLDEKYNRQKIILVPPDFKGTGSEERAEFSHEDLEGARLQGLRNDTSWDRYTQSKDRAIVAARWFDEASSSDLHQWLVTRLHHASARQPIRWLELVRVHPEHPDGDGTIFDQVKKQLERFLTSPNHDRQDSRCIEFIARKLIAAAADAIIAEREPGTSSATSDSPQREIKALLHPEFVPEYRDLHEDVQDVLRRGIELLGRYGPQLGRPYVDTISQSRHPNMKELRFDAAGGTWRVAFAFDPSRQPVLLVAGDKSGGSQERFYDRLIKKADERFGAHVAKMESR